MKGECYALSTVKRYAGLACQAGTLSAYELAKLRLVQGYAYRERKGQAPG